ncbi:unnamed protein product, partial [Cyprideis torosa]
MDTLETLKKEAAEISRKVDETDRVIKEIDSVSQQYLPLSQACSSIYFTLETLSQVHFLYQYSLHSFLKIYTSVLTATPKLAEVKDPAERLALITRELF